MCFNKLIKKANSKVKKLKGYDISLIKLSVFFFTLLLVKYYPSLTTLDWYCYVIAFCIAGFIPFKKFFID